MMFFLVILLCSSSLSASQYFKGTSIKKSQYFAARNKWTENPADGLNQYDFEYSGSYQPNTDQYTGRNHQSPRKASKSSIVDSYIESLSSRLAVAFAAGVTTYLLTMLLSLMVINKSFKEFNAAFACIGICFTFLHSKLAGFFRALGVFSILLIKGFKFQNYIFRCYKQIKGMLMLSERKNFPPFSDNPWKYLPMEGEEDIEFKMVSCIIAISMLGGAVVWRVTKMIPLFPGWIGAIGGAAIFGFGSTASDGRGDMLRFIGWSLTALLTEISYASDDVELKERAAELFSQIVAIATKIDKNYGVISKGKYFLAEMTKIIVSMISKIRNDQGIESYGRENNNNLPNNRNRENAYTQERQSKYRR